MQLDLYNTHFNAWFTDAGIRKGVDDAVALLKSGSVKRIFFIGNGGSMAICSHMMEDYAKIGRFPTFAFSDAALITCYANDYGYENAMAEWLKVHMVPGDLLVAISSSGESKNIVNAAKAASEKGGQVLTVSGFNAGNTLSTMGSINFHTPARNYGVVECFHQVILHAILDSLNG